MLSLEVQSEVGNASHAMCYGIIFSCSVMANKRHRSSMTWSQELLSPIFFNSVLMIDTTVPDLTLPQHCFLMRKMHSSVFQKQRFLYSVPGDKQSAVCMQQNKFQVGQKLFLC
jgi:hypothetical protein